MTIVEPQAIILDLPTREDGIKLLKKVEWIGRISHRSEDKQTSDSWERFIKGVVLTHGDWSITEHETVTVDALVDRGITHEWVRHRIGAYTQESTRFVNYQKKVGLQFIAPFHQVGDDLFEWDKMMKTCSDSYNHLIGIGTPPQLARSILPNSLASRLIVTYNLRNWRHFFLMRTSLEAHPQMKQVTIPLLKEFQEKIPLLYDDIVPETRQADNLKMVR